MKKRLLALILCLCTALPLVGCGGTTASKEAGTINIMMIRTGWGTTWLEDAKEKFETLYADEGYKVNILPTRPDFSSGVALNDIRGGYEKTGYDIVISSGYTVQDLTDENYTTQVAPLTDVMNSKPINFDGSLGDDTIKDMSNPTQAWRIKIGDTYWGVPYTSAVRGLVCNMDVLNKYGITELPVTTDEFFKQMDIVYKGTDDVAGTKPMVFAGDTTYGAPSYAVPTLYNTIAQLMGVDAYDDFASLNYLLDGEGKIKADGYNHVNNDAVKEAIEVAMHSFDLAYSINISNTASLSKAHGAIATGKAAFMFDGSFFFTEIKTEYASSLNDVRFCNLPIVSQLGVELQLDGTGTDKAKCDQILSFMAKKVDDGKTAEEIKSLTEAEFSITLTPEKVNRVIEARTTVNGGESYLSIMKGSPNEEISKLFIRMLLSEDAATEIYSKYGMFSPTYKNVGGDNQYQFINDAHKVYSIADYYTTSEVYPNSVRDKANNMFLLPNHKAYFIKDFGMPSITDATKRNYESLASDFFDEVVLTTKNNWKSYMSMGGYTLATAQN